MELINSPGKDFRDLTEEEWIILEEEMVKKIIDIQSETLTIIAIRATFPRHLKAVFRRE